MQNKCLIAAVFAATLAVAAPAGATDLVYTPINPSFGGNPLNSSHLLGLANAQRDATASDANDGTGGGGGGGDGDDGGDSDADLFIRQLQGRLLSALASQVTDAIFGDNPQDHGTVQFGDTTVEFDNTGSEIVLTITNATDGSVTVIRVPQLVTSSSFAAAPKPSALSEPALSGSLAGSSTLAQQPLSQSLLKPLN